MMHNKSAQFYIFQHCPTRMTTSCPRVNRLQYTVIGHILPRSRPIGIVMTGCRLRSKSLRCPPTTGSSPPNSRLMAVVWFLHRDDHLYRSTRIGIRRLIHRGTITEQRFCRRRPTTTRKCHRTTIRECRRTIIGECRPTIIRECRPTTIQRYGPTTIRQFRPTSIRRCQETGITTPRWSCLTNTEWCTQITTPHNVVIKTNRKLW